MRRVQIQFTEQQARSLQELAEDSHRPVASIVRDAVEAWIAAQRRREQRERMLAAVGGFHSGLGDLAERHDFYLDEVDE
jgi:hypothetical protein